MVFSDGVEEMYNFLAPSSQALSAAFSNRILHGSCFLYARLMCQNVSCNLFFPCR
jgi:hypothetical protein